MNMIEMGRLIDLKVYTSGLVKCCDSYWMLDYKYNIIYEIDIKQYIARIAGKIEISEKNRSYQRKYLKLITHDKYLYAIPCAPVPIVRFDVSNGSMDYITYPTGKKTFDGHLFGDAVLMEGNIIFIPYSYENILLLNVKSRMVKTKTIENHDGNERESRYYAWDGYIVDDSTIWFTSFSEKLLCSYDAIRNIERNYTLPIYDKNPIGIAKGSESAFVILANADFIIEVIVGESVEIINKIYYPNGFVPGRIAFSQIIDTEEECLLLPRDANMTVILQKKLRKTEKVTDESNTADEYFKRYYKYSYFNKGPDDYYIANTGASTIFGIKHPNEDNHIVKVDAKDLMKCITDTNNIINEDDSHGLSLLVNGVL